MNEITEMLFKLISPFLAILGLATLWGKHKKSVEVHEEQFNEFKKSQGRQRTEDQARINKQYETLVRRIESSDNQLAETIKNIYDRIHADDVRRDEREDNLRADLNRVIDKFDTKVDEQNSLYRELINYLK